ncbi:unnamed protein product, partial [Brassica rapa subsp. trilocularis]
ANKGGGSRWRGGFQGRGVKWREQGSLRRLTSATNSVGSAWVLPLGFSSLSSGLHLYLDSPLTVRCSQIRQ